MRGNYFGVIAVAMFILIQLVPISLQAVELFAVGPRTAEYFDGSAWTQRYGAKQYELNRLLGVWGASDTDIYTVGTNGTIAHYDGSLWSDMYSGTSFRLESIWGSSGSDIFAVGAGGTILHFDGIHWSAMDSRTTKDLYDIWGISSNDVYAVGYEIVLHYNGFVWGQVPVGVSAVYEAVWASSSTEVFISYSNNILYYNGTKWKELTNNPATSTINDIWGTSTDEVFFACDYGIILHYNGGKFTSTDLGSDNLEGISGTASDNVYAASSSHGIVFHYNGSEWTSDEIRYFMYLYDIFAVSTDNIVTVGSDVYYPDFRAKIYQFDGVDWSYMMPDAFPQLKHVWANSSDNVFVVGNRETVDNIVFHYDGIEWTETAPVPPLGPIWDIWGTSSHNVYAVTQLGNDHERGSILHYDGSSWSVMADFGDNLWSIWGNSNSDIYTLVSNSVYHYDGSEWVEIAVTPYSFWWGRTSIYGSTSGEVLVVGTHWPLDDDLRYLAHYYDGSEWSTMEPSQTLIAGHEYTSIWGYSADDIYFTIGTRIFHFDGIESSSIEPPTGFGVTYDTWGDSEGNLYFVNETDEIHHFDGSDWSTIYTGNEESFLCIWGWEDVAADAEETPPASFALHQNYPNPFNPATAIEYYLEKEGHVTLDIYSASGRLICTLLDDFQTQGRHTIHWGGRDDNGQQVASGIYFCRITTPSGMQAKKMVLVR
jgi:hypothetical protein